MVIRWICLAMLMIAMQSCTGVKVTRLDANDYMSLRRGDVLMTGKLSTYTRTALQVVGVDERDCYQLVETCRYVLMYTNAMSQEQRLSALSELWLQEAIMLDKGVLRASRRQATLHAYLESSRYAYAYLFMTDRTPSMRALEDRQTQVLDYYNFAVQHVVAGVFRLHKSDLPAMLDHYGQYRFAIDDVVMTGHIEHRTDALAPDKSQTVMPAAALTFEGVRNIYRRDGIGAEMVLLRSGGINHTASRTQPWNEMHYPAMTAVLRFEGNTLDEVLVTNSVTFAGYDPYHRETVSLSGMEMPLAGNFTSSYGLWLARSGFTSQAWRTLIGRGNVLEHPRVYMMQPFDPARRIIVMVHGLASSPEAWINVANEILGDESLRRHYQIWQVYYPTNMPIAANHHAIRQALAATLQYVDPTKTTLASKNMVVLGHSMGGIVSRLMVSASGPDVWDTLQMQYKLDEPRLHALQEKIGIYVMFDAVPEISRAIFVATPHGGSPVAKNFFVQLLSGFMRLPSRVASQMTDIATLLRPTSATNVPSVQLPLTSVANLREDDTFLNLMRTLPVAPDVPYHSIIGNATPALALETSSDGVVPYRSAHLSGAMSEKVIRAGHSVQETPEAIVEIRRILRQHLLTMR
jgi:pimeloyl-ACP methyl ester carboxylesterase